MHLFVIYIGGVHEQSIIELHDMRFVIADSIKSTYEPLRKSWWGTPQSLHIDAWGILDYADGYDIIIKDHPPLYNINIAHSPTSNSISDQINPYSNKLTNSDEISKIKSRDYKLYFVNLGGYDSNQFTELHKNVFIVAENPNKAKIKALKQILNWELHHMDYQFEVDNIIDITSTIDNNYYIHLLPTTETKDFKFVCNYIPIKNV